MKISAIFFRDLHIPKLIAGEKAEETTDKMGKTILDNICYMEQRSQETFINVPVQEFPQPLAELLFQMQCVWTF